MKNVNSEVFELMEKFSKLNISSMKLQREDFSLELKKSSDVVSIPKDRSQDIIEPIANNKAYDDELAENNYYKITSPLMGVFYSTPGPELPPFVKKNEEVKKGDVLCTIEAMKMFNEIQAPVNGVVRKIHFSNEDLVQANDVIIEIEEK